MSGISDDDINQAALDPKQASVDGNTVVARSIDELIKARNEERRTTAADRDGLPIRMGKFRPPGAV